MPVTDDCSLLSIRERGSLINTMTSDQRQKIHFLFFYEKHTLHTKKDMGDTFVIQMFSEQFILERKNMPLTSIAGGVDFFC